MTHLVFGFVAFVEALVLCLVVVVFFYFLLVFDFGLVVVALGGKMLRMMMWRIELRSLFPLLLLVLLLCLE